MQQRDKAMTGMGQTITIMTVRQTMYTSNSGAGWNVTNSMEIAMSHRQYLDMVKPVLLLNPIMRPSFQDEYLSNMSCLDFGTW